MAYIGKTPVIGNFVKLDAITAVNGQAAYTMQNGGSNFTDYESVNQFLVSLNGTIQAPTDSFTVSGSTLTFASNLSTGDVIDFIIVFGNSLSAGTPTDATVTTAKLADDAVTGAKLANDIGISTTGNIATTSSGTITSAGLITASSGVAIGGTGSANTLDDYEEGTWTPSFANAGSASFNSNGQQGYYTKVGRLVTVGFNLSISNLSGGSGAATIITLPFAASNTPDSARYMGTIGGDDNWSTDLSGNNTVLQIYGDYLNTRIFLQKNNCNNKADIQLSDIGTSRVLGTITYFTDA